MSASFGFPCPVAQASADSRVAVRSLLPQVIGKLQAGSTTKALLANKPRAAIDKVTRRILVLFHTQPKAGAKEGQALCQPKKLAPNQIVSLDGRCATRRCCKQVR